MTNKEPETGFRAPQEPQDEWTAKLYEKYELEATPSLEKIEPVATKLLGNPLTFISGAELTLGRRVDAKDPEVIPIIATPGLSAEDKFGLLLLQKEVENIQREKKTKGIL